MIMGLSFTVEADIFESYPAARRTMLRSAWVNIKKADGIAYSNRSFEGSWSKKPITQKQFLDKLQSMQII